jgi:hypothetical protein
MSISTTDACNHTHVTPPEKADIHHLSRYFDKNTVIVMGMMLEEDLSIHDSTIKDVPAKDDHNKSIVVAKNISILRWGYTSNKLYANMVTALFQFLRDDDVKHRDVIQLKENVFKNDTKLIWCNDKCVSLDCLYDKYGAVPPLEALTVPENFPINYWYSAID